MKPGANFDTVVFGPQLIVVPLVKRKIGQGSSKEGVFSATPSMSPFLAISFCMVIEN